MGRSTGRLGTAGAWLLLSAFAAPAPRLPYDATLFDQAPPPAPAPAEARLSYRLTADFAVVADSNATGGTRLSEIPVLAGGERIPVPLDPRLRRKSGIGRSAALSGSVEIPVAPAAAITAAADASLVDYDGRIADDASVTFSAGAAVGGPAHRTTVEALLFDRWYGGVSAMAGWGLRATQRLPIGPRENLRLGLEARGYRSAYGRAFDGRQGMAWLAWDAVLAPGLTGSASLYVRRDALRDPAYAGTELGGSAGLSAWLGSDLAGSATLGLSRAWFDAAIPWLASSARADWRPSLNLWLATRRPLLFGFTPSLAYSYGRTASTLPFYASDRHRLRLGLARTFD